MFNERRTFPLRLGKKHTEYETRVLDYRRSADSDSNIKANHSPLLSFLFSGRTHRHGKMLPWLRDGERVGKILLKTTWLKRNLFFHNHLKYMRRVFTRDIHEASVHYVRCFESQQIGLWNGSHWNQASSSIVIASSLSFWQARCSGENENDRKILGISRFSRFCFKNISVQSASWRTRECTSTPLIKGTIWLCISPFIKWI